VPYPLRSSMLRTRYLQIQGSGPSAQVALPSGAKNRADGAAKLLDYKLVSEFTRELMAAHLE
jgi:hypothetical protein